MGWTRMMRELEGAVRGDGDQANAYQLFAAMLDDGVPDLELGAVLALLQARTLSAEQLSGFHAALAERCARLSAPDAPAAPVVLASPGGTCAQPNLVPLLALLLQRLRVPVLVHGALHASGRTTAAAVLRELGVMPCVRLAQVQSQLEEALLAFVPTAVLAPGFAKLAGTCARLGLAEPASTLARLIDPFGGASLLVVGTEGGPTDAMHGLMAARRLNALLFQGTEGEAFADPLGRPDLVYWADGERQTLFEAQAAPLRHLSHLPHEAGAAATAAWTKRVVAGEAPLPLPIANQIACCLFGSGYTHDMNQAKAIAAIETGGLAVA